MLRIEGDRRFQLREQLRRDPCRLRVRHAVHDAVTYRRHLGKLRLRFEPLEERLDRRAKASRLERHALRLLSLSGAHLEYRAGLADALDLAVLELRGSRAGAVEREPDAR